MAAMVDSAFQLSHIHRELLLPLAFAVPVLGLLHVCLVNILARVGAVVADHGLVQKACSTRLKGEFHRSLFLPPRGNPSSLGSPHLPVVFPLAPLLNFPSASGSPL